MMEVGLAHVPRFRAINEEVVRFDLGLSLEDTIGTPPPPPSLLHPLSPPPPLPGAQMKTTFRAMLLVDTLSISFALHQS